MDISMDIDGKSMDMDMDMDGKFHIHGKLGYFDVWFSAEYWHIGYVYTKFLADRILKTVVCHGCIVAKR